MDKLKNIFTSFSFSRFSQGNLMADENINLLWRVLLGVAVLIGVGSATFALFTYQWATEAVPQTITGRSRVPFSIDELHDVISLYEKKEASFHDLENRPPLAPRLEGGESEPAQPVATTTGITL